MAAFDEVQFPVDMSYGAVGGAGYLTDIIITAGGAEVRNRNWQDARGSWDVSFQFRDQAKIDILVSFFRARRGKAVGFRFRDWVDYIATLQSIVLTGSRTVQLVRNYVSGAGTEIRIISKPVTTPAVTMERNSSSFTGFSLDTATGIATLTADSSLTISNITQADPGVVTTNSSHSFSNGDEIWIRGVVGMIDVNNKVQTIANVTATTFEIEDTTGFAAYSTGTDFAEKYIQPGETLTWTGEFDVPVRFDTDEMKASVDAFNLFTWDGIPIIEVRIP